MMNVLCFLNTYLAGNKTIENANAIGLEDIIIVETTGNQIVAVKRLDIDLDSKMGRELAFEVFHSFQ